MTAYSYQSIGYTGANVTFSAPSAFPGGNTVPVSARGFLWVKNTSGSTENIAIGVPGTSFALQAFVSVTVTVPIGESLIGPLTVDLFDPAVGGVGFIIADVTGITAAAVELPTPPPDLP